MMRDQYSRQSVFAAACVGMLVFGVFLTTLGSILPSIIERFGVHKAQAGSLLLLMNLGVMAGSLFFGPVVDRYGFKVMLIVSAAMILVGLEGIAFARTFGWLRAAVFLSGLGGGVLNGGTNALVADISSGGRGAGLSLLGVFFGVGGFAVPFALGFLISSYSYSEIISVVGGGVAIPLVFFAAIRFPSPKQPRGFPLREGVGVLGNRTFLLLAFILLLQSGVEITATGWSAAYFVDVLSIDTGDAALLLSMYWVGLTLGRLVAGARLRRTDPVRVVQASLVLGGAGIVVMLISTNFLVAAVGIFAAGLGFAAIFPYILGFVGDLYPGISGTAFGLAFVIALIGGTIFPYVIGLLGETLGLHVSFVLIPLSLVVSAVLLANVAGRLRYGGAAGQE